MRILPAGSVADGVAIIVGVGVTGATSVVGFPTSRTPTSGVVGLGEGPGVMSATGVL